MKSKQNTFRKNWKLQLIVVSIITALLFALGWSLDSRNLTTELLLETSAIETIKTEAIAVKSARDDYFSAIGKRNSGVYDQYQESTSCTANLDSRLLFSKNLRNDLGRLIGEVEMREREQRIEKELQEGKVEALKIMREVFTKTEQKALENEEGEMRLAFRQSTKTLENCMAARQNLIQCELEFEDWIEQRIRYQDLILKLENVLVEKTLAAESKLAPLKEKIENKIYSSWENTVSDNLGAFLREVQPKNLKAALSNITYDATYDGRGGYHCSNGDTVQNPKDCGPVVSNTATTYDATYDGRGGYHCSNGDTVQNPKDCGPVVPNTAKIVSSANNPTTNQLINTGSTASTNVFSFNGSQAISGKCGSDDKGRCKKGSCRDNQERLWIGGKSCGSGVVCCADKAAAEEAQGNSLLGLLRTKGGVCGLNNQGTCVKNSCETSDERLWGGASCSIGFNCCVAKGTVNQGSILNRGAAEIGGVIGSVVGAVLSPIGSLIGGATSALNEGSNIIANALGLSTGQLDSVVAGATKSNSGPVFGGHGAVSGLNIFKQNYSGRKYGNAIGMITGWTNFALPFIGALAIAAIVYAGFLYITSAGNNEQTEKAKKIIIWVVIGIIVIFSAYAIVNTLLSGNSGGGGRGTSIDVNVGGINASYNK